MKTMSVKAAVAREAILKRITRGDVKPGDRIPPERELARQLGMNHQTVRRGLAQLVEEGVIVTQPGVGSFVQPSTATRVTTGVALILPARLFRIESFSVAGMLIEGA